jgi:putative salt-induced outer membrane protein YdiY
MSFAVMLPILSSLMQSSQDNTNRRNAFDSNIATLVNSPYTGRQAGDFSKFLGNTSLNNLKQGLDSSFAQSNQEQRYADNLAWEKAQAKAAQDKIDAQTNPIQNQQNTAPPMGLSLDKYSLDPNKALTFSGLSSLLLKR